jgi:hypothetical protein
VSPPAGGGRRHSLACPWPGLSAPEAQGQVIGHLLRLFRISAMRATSRLGPGDGSDCGKVELVDDTSKAKSVITTDHIVLATGSASVQLPDDRLARDTQLGSPADRALDGGRHPFDLLKFGVASRPCRQVRTRCAWLFGPRRFHRTPAFRWLRTPAWRRSRRPQRRRATRLCICHRPS